VAEILRPTDGTLVGGSHRTVFRKYCGRVHVLFKFYWSPVRAVLPLVVLSALYTYSVSDFVLLLFSVDK